jgi:hypothetical protein
MAAVSFARGPQGRENYAILAYFAVFHHHLAAAYEFGEMEPSAGVYHSYLKAPRAGCPSGKVFPSPSKLQKVGGERFLPHFRCTSLADSMYPDPSSSH